MKLERDRLPNTNSNIYEVLIQFNFSGVKIAYLFCGSVECLIAVFVSLLRAKLKVACYRKCWAVEITDAYNNL